ncbi:MAG: phenylacetate--CoA ligase family protein [Burkholderiales bacterium]|nr:phenylacetate--CoA ligase family protein [Burkholderiales bacterium]
MDTPVLDTNVPACAIPGLAFPAIPGTTDALVLSMLREFARDERLQPSQLLALQLQQVEALVEHAMRTVPWYRRHYRQAASRWKKAPAMESFQRLPILTRRSLQNAARELRSDAIPREHGRLGVAASSGSTGRPVQVLQPELLALPQKAHYLAQYLRHGIDLSAKVAAIRKQPPGYATPPEGAREALWAAGYPCGPAVQLSIEATVGEQIEWLARERPAYLLSYPSNLAALARRLRETATAIPSLRALRSFAEVLDPSVRALCGQVFGVAVIDEYSAVETGPIAMQCAAHEHLHVCSESVLVEVLDQRDRPCPPGAIGRVVVTVLHNFAMPLIRYELGDYAQLDAPCPRGGPHAVLKRVLGRARNMLRLPSGETRWPLFRCLHDAEVVRVEQCQVIQRSLTDILVLIVTSSPIGASQRDALVEGMQRDLGYAFDVELRRVDAIERAAGGKFEDFRCELQA